MAAIKSFTSLEQSKKLAEILPLESADMRIGNYVGKSGKVDGTNVHYYTKGESFGAPEIINAWSLAALLKLLPKSAQLEKGNVTELYRVTLPVELETSDWYIEPIEACYEMIIKLHELKML